MSAILPVKLLHEFHTQYNVLLPFLFTQYCIYHMLTMYYNVLNTYLHFFLHILGYVYFCPLPPLPIATIGTQQLPFLFYILSKYNYTILV
jgi:hypothetical protein